ncbi:Tim44/TimA family putative adaptor protein [Bartonella vinsonii]|uniref:Large ribosomal subunit protein mL45 n=1 Tax=Bartonella vinsonii subsp. berkhoffii str. Tweed TaxID=1094502 RepID=N6UZE6_BARVB|nr:Tim44/TimA family putative adaptor protein [Bartonella vinsonii]AGF75251.1 putative translocase transmembrane protein [Bartonella vinsonii subsp. berkhoffii str. Winnie]ENN95443.1 putative translocase transmembrane protein [Bartonella vinsonii subsp. berkhoffii str. Tweed]
MEFDIILVVALVIMVVVFVQLRNVLGKRIGFEKPPFDPYSRNSKKQLEKETADNAVSFPHQGNSQKSVFDEIDAISPEGSALNKGLRALYQNDPHFSPHFFIKGAQVAYEMIVTAFAKGDRDQLKKLLSQDVFERFCAAIEQREKNNEKIQFTFVGINKIEFIAAEIQEKEQFLTVRIVSEMISMTYNEKGESIDGDPDAIVEIKDIWTFVRNSLSSDPNWKLFATEDEN